MKITIVTVTLNRGFEIEKTIQSVLSQTFKNLEYWIIDGCSSDNTLQILQKYQNHLSFISEKDQGIYSAMNKGIERATGNYLIFLNAGDYFISDTSLEILVNNSNYEDLIYGDILVIDNKTEWPKSYPKILNMEYFLNDTLPHPATLIKRTLFNQIGLFNEKNFIISDWEFFINAVCKFNAKYKYVNAIITIFKADGISGLPENAKVIFEEKQRFISENYPEFLNNYLKLHNQIIKSKPLHHSNFNKIKSYISGKNIFDLFRKSFL